VKKILGFTMVATLLACGGGGNKPDLSSQVQHANGPDWVYRSSGAFGSDKGKVFYGVGIASGIRNAGMRRSTSEARARSEITRVLDNYASILSKDYKPTTSASDGKDTSEKQRLEQALKDYSQSERSSVQIIDHWVDNDGNEYALASLALDTFKGDMARMKELDAETRDAVRAGADTAFDELSAEEAKQR
jgi:hypothetical protein